MARKGLFYLISVFFILGLIIYLLNFFKYSQFIVERLFVTKYFVKSVFEKNKNLPTQENIRILISNEDGSELKRFSLKYAFGENLFFQEVFQLGNSRYQTIVFSYYQNGKIVTMIVPIRGVVGWVDQGATETKLIDPKELMNLLAKNEQVRLSFLFKYSDEMASDQIKENLINLGIGRLGSTAEEVDWVLGSFPSKDLYSDGQIRGVFTDNSRIFILEEGVRLGSISKL